MLPNLFYICVVSTICVIKTKFNLNADKAGFRNTTSNLLHLNYSVVCIITFNSREKKFMVPTLFCIYLGRCLLRERKFSRGLFPEKISGANINLRKLLHKIFVFQVFCFLFFISFVIFVVFVPNFVIFLT